MRLPHGALSSARWLWLVHGAVRVAVEVELVLVRGVVRVVRVCAPVLVRGADRGYGVLLSYKGHYATLAPDFGRFWAHFGAFWGAAPGAGLGRVIVCMVPDLR